MVSIKSLGVVLATITAAAASANSTLNATTSVVIPTSTTVCTTVITSLVEPRPTLCGCGNDDALDKLIDAESKIGDSVNKILDILGDADVNISGIEDILDGILNDLTSLGNAVNGAGCLATTVTPVLTNIVHAVLQVVTLIINAITANALGSISTVIDILKSIGEAIASVVDAIKIILSSRDIAECFICQDISTINNLLETLETAIKRVIPVFPNLPKLPGCVPSVTSLVTSDIPCAASATGAFAFALYGADSVATYCTTTFTTTAAPAVTDICDCKENPVLDGLAGILNQVISTVKHFVTNLPPLPGILEDIKSKLLPLALDELTKILNAILGVGCISASSGVISDSLKSLFEVIKQALDLIQSIVQGNVDGALDTVISILTILINAINTLIDNIWSLLKSESFTCFACADIATINDAIAEINELLAKIPLFKGVSINRLPQCDVATVVTSLVPCAATPSA